MTFGYDLPERAVELVNLRLGAFGPSPNIPWPKYPAGGETPPKPVGQRIVRHRAHAAATAWPVFRFESLHPEVRVDGPAIIEYRGSTLVVPPQWMVRYDLFMNAIVSRN